MTMPHGELLALDALIVALEHAIRRNLDQPAEPGAADAPTSIRQRIARDHDDARTLLFSARRYTRLPASVPAIDDALAYLSAMIVPELRPTPTTNSLREIVAWHERNSTVEARVQPALWRNAEQVLERSRREHLAELAATEVRRINAFLDTEPRRHLGIRPAGHAQARSADARDELALQLAHGLVYEIEPDALMRSTAPGRIGGIAQSARSALAAYREARRHAGHPALGRRAQRLATMAQHVEPQLFDR